MYDNIIVLYLIYTLYMQQQRATHTHFVM